MPSLHESRGDVHRRDDLMVDANDNLGSLKEKTSKYVAYGGKLDSSRFVEYWIPVQISNVQLEQYCGTLLSKSLSLCSPLKNDPVGVLHDILISARKVGFIRLFCINYMITWNLDDTAFECSFHLWQLLNIESNLLNICWCYDLE